MPAPYPWWSKKSWYPNCCCNECLIFHDDCRGYFPLVPAAWWHEYELPSSSQPWKTDVYDTSSSFGEIGYVCGDGFLICKTEISEAPYNCVVGAKFLWATATDTATARMVVDYVDDDNFHYVDIDHDGSRTGDSIEIRFYDRAAGANTQIGSTISVDSSELTGWPSLYVVVCKSTTAITLNIFSATTPYANGWPPFTDQNTSFYAEAQITNKAGKQAGVGLKGAYLGSGGSRTDDDYGIRLQEFWLERTADENSNCEACERLCCSDATPLEFDLTIANVADGTACDSCDPDLNGDFTLTLDRTEGTNCRWIYDAGYSSDIYFCSGEDTSTIDQGISRITLTVTQVGTDPTFNSEWRLRLDGPAYSTHYELTLTRSGWLGLCAFDGSESWSFDTRSNFNCNMTSATFTVTS